MGSTEGTAEMIQGWIPGEVTVLVTWQGGQGRSMAGHLPSQVKSYKTLPNSQPRRWSPQKQEPLNPRPEGGNTVKDEQEPNGEDRGGQESKSRDKTVSL